MALSNEEKQEIIKAIDQEISNREIARTILGRESRESSIRHFRKQMEKELNSSTKAPRILIGDVECSSTVSYTFSRFKAFISPIQVIQEPYLLTFAGKWLNQDTVFSYKLTDYPLFQTDYKSDYELVKDIWNLLDQCDIFIAHNANFDKGWMNARFALYGLNPPSPYKVIDTLKQLRQHFTLPANSLAAACQYFNLKNQKLDNSGFELWRRCMEGHVEAFDEMETYNIGDILALEELYLKILPWIKDHPNLALYYKDAKPRCVKCGSEDLVLDPSHTVFTAISEFELYKCSCCGSHNRARTNIRTKEMMKSTLANVL